MGDYFRGWRRKIGIVTLLLAGVFTGGWVRSMSYIDGLVLPNPSGLHHQLASYQGCLHWQSLETTQSIPRSGWFRWASHAATASTPNLMVNLGSWRWKIAGFGVRQYVDDNSHVITTAIPYWFFTFPLTLLSAYLLLSKPRKSTQERTTESASVEGATS